MSPEGRPPAKWRRIVRAVKEHPRWLAGIYAVIAVQFLVAAGMDGREWQMASAIIWGSMAVSSVALTPPRVREHDVVVARSVFGSTTIAFTDIDHIVIPHGWSTDVPHLLRRDGQRVTLRQFDPPRARALAAAAGVPVVNGPPPPPAYLITRPRPDASRPDTGGTVVRLGRPVSAPHQAILRAAEVGRVCDAGSRAGRRRRCGDRRVVCGAGGAACRA